MTYFDHNATTPVRPEVLEALIPFLRGKFGNPNSVYALGQESRAAVEAARTQVAGLLNAAADEILFTSCGSESDALAIAGGAQFLFQQTQGVPKTASGQPSSNAVFEGVKNHIVVSSIEHDAIGHLVEGLKSLGFHISVVPVDGYARVFPEEVRKHLTPQTAMVSVMTANNEVGTIQPIQEIAAVCREKGILFHTDAVQAVGRISVDVRALGVDLLSLSGHKINAPKGVGALFVRRGVRLAPIIAGNQEKNRRGGTENVAGIVGLGKACEIARAELESNMKRLLALRRRLEEGCLKISGSQINGHPTERLPGTCHVSFEGVDGHALVVALDLEGICAATGPACSSGSTEPSHVLQAMGIDPKLDSGSLRLSMGWGSSDADVDHLLKVLPQAVEKLRQARRQYVGKKHV